MAYQTLYRKYRPTSFDEVVGQKHIVQTLKNAIVQDRIAHAYLFCGPRGTGKTSIAKIFARTLNCTSENQNRPCGHCDNCEMSLNGSHPDIIEIDAASNNGVDEVRNLIERVNYAPMQGKYKVYIIDEVHMMTTGAFNALLKTIEEPPEHVVFILATTEPNKVLATIISRCQRFDFTKIGQKDIESRLHVVCEREKIEIDDEAISLVATLSDGGMRDALSILDQCIAFCENKIKADDIRQIYGVLTKEDIGRLFKNLTDSKVDDVVEQLQDAYDRGMDLKRLTSDFISLLKDSIILDYSENSTLVNEHTKEVVQKYMLNSSLLFRHQLLDVLMDTFNKYVYASNVLDYLEASLLKTISKSYESVNRVKKEEIILKESSEDRKPSHDLKSEESDIKEEKNEKSDKISKSELDIISDVSRETLKQSEIEDSKIILDDEFILQLLVGGDKKERLEDMKQYENRIFYLTNPEYARFAGLLKNSSIFASADTYLVVCVSNYMEADEINELENKTSYVHFTNELLGKPKKIFAIDQTQRNKIVQEFKSRMENNTLPSAAHVEIHMNEEEIQENSEESLLKDIFPEIEVKED